MKKSMRILSGFLSCLLLLTGCSPTAKNASSSEIQPKSEVITDNTQTAVQTVAPAGKGMFVATKVGPEDINAVKSMTQLTDGSLMFYTENLSQKFVSQDNGLTWQGSDGPKTDVQYDISTIAIRNDGTTYAAWEKYRWSDSDVSPLKAINKISPDGSMSDITIPELEKLEKKGYYTHLANWRFMGNNHLYISAQYDSSEEDSIAETSFGMYNAETYEKIYDLDLESSYYEGSAVSDEENMYVLKSANKEKYSISVLSLADGTEQRSIDLPQELNIIEKDILSTPKDGLLYLAGREHIYQINLKDGKIVDKGQTAQLPLANRINDISSIITLSETELLCSSYNGDIWRFVFDENYQPKEDGSLIIWSLRENRALRTLATAYQDQNPDSVISIEYGFTYDQVITPAEKEDYIRDMNTRLLAGEPVDLIVLDNLPAQQYAKQGLLSDIKSNIDTSDFYGSFAKQLEIDNHLYYVPLSWFAPAMKVRKDAVKNIPTSFEDWMKFIETTPAYDAEYFNSRPKKEEEIPDPDDESIEAVPPDKRTFTDGFLQDLYDMFWAANEPALIQNNKISEENMKSFLKAMKLFADKNGLNTEEYLSRSGNGWDVDTYKDRSLEFEGANDRGVSSYRAVIAGVHMAYLEMIQNTYMFGGSDFTAKTCSSWLPAPSMAGSVWRPYRLLGISTKSTKKEAATKFIQFALSPAMQMELNEDRALPITKAAHLRKIENEKESYRQEVANLTSEERKEQEEMEGHPIKPEFEYDEQLFLRFAEQLKTPLITDYAVRNMVWEPMRDYTRNLLSLEEAMNQINSKTKIYLSEKIQ